MEKTEKENILRPLVCISQTYILLLDRTHNVMHENRWLKWWRSFGKKWNNKDARLFSPIIFGTNRKIFSASATSMAILIQWISISNTGFLSHESILAIRFSRTFFLSARETHRNVSVRVYLHWRFFLRHCSSPLYGGIKHFWMSDGLSKRKHINYKWNLNCHQPAPSTDRFSSACASAIRTLSFQVYAKSTASCRLHMHSLKIIGIDYVLHRCIVDVSLGHKHYHLYDGKRHLRQNCTPQLTTVRLQIRNKMKSPLSYARTQAHAHTHTHTHKNKTLL